VRVHGCRQDLRLAVRWRDSERAVDLSEEAFRSYRLEQHPAATSPRRVSPHLIGRVPGQRNNGNTAGGGMFSELLTHAECILERKAQVGSENVGWRLHRPDDRRRIGCRFSPKPPVGEKQRVHLTGVGMIAHDKHTDLASLKP